MKKAGIIIESLILMTALQAVKLAIEAVVRPYLPAAVFIYKMTTACIMVMLAVVVYVYARLRKTPLCVLPVPFGGRYIIFTCIAAALLISSPSNYTGGCQPLLLAVYGSIITPVYEELLFRGYLWSRFNTVLSRELYTYLWSIALFTLWHCGYMTRQIISGDWNAVLWKLAAGVGYGAVLGLVRLKTKNCYSTVLVHGVLNIFMI